MVELRIMTESVFNEFKVLSQREYAVHSSEVEGISTEDALKNVAELFARLVPNGRNTPGQLFFEVIEKKSGEAVGYLWLGIQERFGRKVTSINDIIVNESRRGEGFGKALMMCVEQESEKAGAKRIRLHVFQRNETARKLYESMGFQISSIDMFKLI